MKQRRPRPTALPVGSGSRWWQHEEERCTFCLQCHATTFDVRCERCDDVLCRLCAVIVVTTSEVVCPTCHTAKER